MPEYLQRDALHAFLRSRRRRTQPEAVGLMPRGRRATPGLRREEVAALAGVSLTWYTRLEQGRPIGVSADVVESLARLYRLTRAETTYLYILARAQIPVDHRELDTAISLHLQQLLDTFSTAPACIINPLWDVLAWNAQFCRVFGDYTLLTQRERNTIWRLFVDPAWRTLIDNWEYEAHKAVSIFRYSTAAYADADWFRTFIEDISACSVEFASAWAAQNIRLRHDERKVIYHPEVGPLALLPTSLDIVETPGLRLVVDLALPEFETAHKLEALAKK